MIGRPEMSVSTKFRNTIKHPQKNRGRRQRGRQRQGKKRGAEADVGRDEGLELFRFILFF